MEEEPSPVLELAGLSSEGKSDDDDDDDFSFSLSSEAILRPLILDYS